MLGHALFEHFNQNSEFNTYGTLRKNRFIKYEGLLDFSSFVYSNIDAEQIGNIENLFIKIKPNVVVNCIGIVKQISVAQNPIPSIAINASFPHHLSQICQKYDARLIQISTDCVFSGIRGNYTEQDNPDPIDIYGRTKLLGEVTKKSCLTLRTSIIGRELETTQGLIEWFLSQKGKTVKGYKKAIFSGFTTISLSEILTKIIMEFPNLYGVWHVASKPISKYDLLSLIKQAYDVDISIEPDQEFVCDRSLNAQRFQQLTGIVPPSWPSMISQMHQYPISYDQIRGNHAH